MEMNVGKASEVYKVNNMGQPLDLFIAINLST